MPVFGLRIFRSVGIPESPVESDKTGSWTSLQPYSKSRSLSSSNVGRHSSSSEGGTCASSRF